MTEKEVKDPVENTPKETKAKKPAFNAGKFAVIKTGGKQYVVHEGRSYDFEKLPEEEGKEIVFSEVYLTADGDKVNVGTPVIEKATVTGKVVSQYRGDKVMVFKYKQRKRYRKTQGHRQSLTKVEITKIG